MQADLKFAYGCGAVEQGLLLVAYGSWRKGWKGARTEFAADFRRRAG
jgi:hypothetical protein